MKGVTVRSPETVEEAQRMHRDGMTYAQIGEALGVARSTAAQWVADPNDERGRARKRRYGGTCPRCGGPRDGSYGPRPRDALCATCLSWTPEEITAALRAYYDEHGEPPQSGVADRRHATPRLPSHESAQAAFGSWAKALRAAGVPVTIDRDPETQRRVEALLAAGVPVREVARELAVTPQAIYERLRLRGLTVADVRARGDRARG